MIREIENLGEINDLIGGNADLQKQVSDARNTESISACLVHSLCVSTYELNAMLFLIDPHLWEREDLAQCKLC